jgi:hypothetical protein
MRRVWIAQCLCGPLRHCIVANVGEANDEAEARRGVLASLHQQVGDMIAGGTFNPWCGICRAPREQWLFEVGRTRFKTMEEAMPTLKRSEAEQAVARLILGGTAGRA